MSESAYQRLRTQYDCMKAEEAKRLKELEDENHRLKQLVADRAWDIQMMAAERPRYGYRRIAACRGVSVGARAARVAFGRGGG